MSQRLGFRGSEFLISFRLLQLLSSTAISSGFLLMAWTLRIFTLGIAFRIRRARESAARLAGVATRKRSKGSAALSSWIMATRVWDLPVPGGPWSTMGALPLALVSAP